MSVEEIQRNAQNELNRARRAMNKGDFNAAVAAASDAYSTAAEKGTSDATCGRIMKQASSLMKSLSKKVSGGSNREVKILE